MISRTIKEEMDINGHINHACHMNRHSEERIEAVDREAFKISKRMRFCNLQTELKFI